MKTIPLSGRAAAGRVALVDDADWAWLSGYRWIVKEFRAKGRRRSIGPYALTEIWTPESGRRTRPYMHLMITGWPMTDHIDHDGLNNQRSNLRQVTSAENQRNQRPYLGRSSPYKGVYWNSRKQKWIAQIARNGTRGHIGAFLSEEDAARAYDDAARALFGEFACLNFPEA